MTHGQHLTPAPLCEAARHGSDPVRFFSQAGTFEGVWPLVRRRLAAALDTGSRAWGVAVAELEAALAAWCDVAEVLAVRSHGDALALLLRAAGAGRGGAVVVPALAPPAAAAAVAATGADVVFADVGPHRRTPTAETLAAAITPHTVAVLLVHPGHAVAWDDVLPVCAARGLAVVEDLGGLVCPARPMPPERVRHIGAAVDLGPTAVLGAVGDAGAVLTHDPGVAHAVRRLRWQGVTEAAADDWPGLSVAATAPATDCRLGDLQAAVLLGKLARLGEALARRTALAACYAERLAGVPQLWDLPPVTALVDYRVETDDRDGLVAHLVGHGIDARPGPPTPLPGLEAFRHRRGHGTVFPHATESCSRALTLPFHTDLSEAAVDRVCAAVASYLTRPRGCLLPAPAGASPAEQPQPAAPAETGGTAPGTGRPPGIPAGTVADGPAAEERRVWPRPEGATGADHCDRPPCAESHPAAAGHRDSPAAASPDHGPCPASSVAPPAVPDAAGEDRSCDTAVTAPAQRTADGAVDGPARLPLTGSRA